MAQGRPRFTTINGHARAYDAPKSSGFKNLVAMIANENMRGQPLSEKPIELRLTVTRSIPSSWSKKKKLQAQDGQLAPTSRPDLDNYLKAVLDALNGIVFKDDSQVVILSALKQYGDKPGTTVVLTEIEKQGERHGI